MNTSPFDLMHHEGQCNRAVNGRERSLPRPFRSLRALYGVGGRRGASVPRGRRSPRPLCSYAQAFEAFYLLFSLMHGFLEMFRRTCFGFSWDDVDSSSLFGIFMISRDFSLSTRSTWETSFIQVYCYKPLKNRCFPKKLRENFQKKLPHFKLNNKKSEAHWTKFSHHIASIQFKLTLRNGQWKRSNNSACHRFHFFTDTINDWSTFLLCHFTCVLYFIFFFNKIIWIISYWKKRESRHNLNNVYTSHVIIPRGNCLLIGKRSTILMWIYLFPIFLIFRSSQGKEVKAAYYIQRQ